jgi:hypothetical protein
MPPAARKGSASKPSQQAITKAPAPLEPVASGDSHQSNVASKTADVANENLDDPDVDAPRVLGLADTEEPRAGVRRDRNAAAWRPVALAPDRSPIVERGTLVNGIVLQLPPSATNDAGRIVGPAGRAIVSETVHSSATGPIEVRIRTDELDAGTYRVQWQGSELHFTVR